MKSHFEHLEFYIPNLLDKKILDLGSGRGKFIIDAKSRGAEVSGLEPYDEYIKMSHQSAKAKGITLEIKQGVAEEIPFQDSSFDFVNICEVIEHVENPEKMLEEVYRVLVSGGQVYLSVPNRFGLKDQHFGLYLVNWLPRRWANKFIGIFGKHKNYSVQAGRQNLADMHYYTYSSIKKLVRKKGFDMQDIRAMKIKRKFPHAWWMLWSVYFVLRTLYLDSFHLILRK